MSTAAPTGWPRRLPGSASPRAIASALLAPNCAEYFELQFACGRLGAIMLPLNWRLTVPELEYILGDSTPKLLVHDKAFAPQAAELAGSARSLTCSRSITTGRTAPTSARWRRRRSRLPPVALDHDDIGMVMYTSGTTGHPKGAIITHGMNVLELRQSRHPGPHHRRRPCSS